MGLSRHGGGVMAASLLAWILMMPPLSMTRAGKTVVDTGAPLSRWETVSHHASADDCRKHRDEIRDEVEKAAASTPQEPLKQGSGSGAGKAPPAFTTLKQRAAAARCVSSSDLRLTAPAASPATL